LFAIFLFLVIVYIRFPYGKTKKWIIIAFENNSSYSLNIKDLKPLFPFGYNFEDVEITKEKEMPFFQARKIRARVQILPLLGGNLKFKYAINAYEGIIIGTAKISHGRKNGKAYISADIQNVNLGKHSIFTRKRGFSLSGKMGGELKIDIEDVNTPTIKGDTVLRIEDGKIRGINIKGMVIKNISCEGIECTFELVQNKIVLKKLFLYGKDIDLRITGMILLEKERMEKSRLYLKLHIKPKKGFERRYRFLFRLFKNLRDKEGYFAIPVQGTLGSPRMAIP